MRRVRIAHVAGVLAAGIGLATLGPSAVSEKCWAQDNKPIKIALLAGLSGIYSDLIQGELEARQMAVEDAGGKVLGRPVEILSADHQNIADIAAGPPTALRPLPGLEHFGSDTLARGAAKPSAL